MPTMFFRSLLALSACLLVSSCSLPINGVCVDGPEKGKPIKAKASFNGLTGTGTITAIAPWGETAAGRYQTSTRSASTAAWNAEAKRLGNTSEASGDEVVLHANGSTQVGTATLLGNQGTVFDVIYWTSGITPMHGQGRVRDTRGNKYRLVW